MNSVETAPTTVDELKEAFGREGRLLAVGNLTKPVLSRCDDVKLVSLKSLTGIIEYEPSEFTFTAMAGTPIAEIVSILADRGQCMPFDPMLVDAGATLGGTVASGLSGPGRFRFGGIRDFLLGVHFISGDGQFIRAGGKVVKNAAGFDLPKFFVGSLGRFGVMTQMTMKVFPRPIATKTLSVSCQSHEQARERSSLAAASRWEADAIDYLPSTGNLLIRLTGPDSAIESLCEDIAKEWGGDVSEVDQPESMWRSIVELDRPKADETVFKVPATAAKSLNLQNSLADDQHVHLHTSAAGNLNWLWVDGTKAVDRVDTVLKSLELSGLAIRGETPRMRIGTVESFQIHETIKRAMDPPHKFPRLCDDVA